MRNTRGVQQEEVNEAADALLAGGNRPTIERIRQRLGRGSPNTVAPMLEIWFSGLGKRLGVAEGSDPDGRMPAAAAQAFAKLWDAALLLASKEAEAALALDKQTLSAAQTSLSEREASLTQQEQALAQRQGVVETLLLAEREKTAGVEARLTAAQEQLRVHEAGNAELRRDLAKVQGLLQTARSNIDDQARQHTQERAKWEERSAGNERRLLGEIDRERAASKLANSDAEEARAHLAVIKADSEDRIAELGRKLYNSELELGISKNAVQVGEQRCEALSEQLREQRENISMLQEQLNQALGAMIRSTAAPKRKSTGSKNTVKP